MLLNLALDLPSLLSKFRNDKLKLINIVDANISFNYILLFHVDDCDRKSNFCATVDSLPLMKVCTHVAHSAASLHQHNVFSYLLWLGIPRTLAEITALQYLEWNSELETACNFFPQWEWPFLPPDVLLMIPFTVMDSSLSSVLAPCGNWKKSS